MIVHSIDRLARNLSDFQKIVDGLISRKISVSFHKENLLFSGDDNPMNKLMLQIKQTNYLQIVGSLITYNICLLKENGDHFCIAHQSVNEHDGNFPKH